MEKIRPAIQGRRDITAHQQQQHGRAGCQISSQIYRLNLPLARGKRPFQGIYVHGVSLFPSYVDTRTPVGGVH